MTRVAPAPLARVLDVRVVFLVLLCATLTLVLQEWVGDSTIYAERWVAAREEAHAALLHNRLPAGAPSWESVGMNGLNVRVGVVYLAEGIHRVSGIRVVHVYHLIDSAALFASFLLLFVLLARRAPASHALIGVLFVATVLPLTYFLHRYHPWDRASMCLWIGLIMLLERRRLGAFALLLPLAVVVKYDVAVLPGLYFLLEVDREHWSRVTLRTIALLVLSFGTYALLLHLLPGGAEPRHPLAQILRNLTVLREMHLRYPPLLMFGGAAALAAYGIPVADRFARACAIFSLVVAVPLAVLTNFVEVRAETMLLLLLLPAMMAGLDRLLAGTVADGHAALTPAVPAAASPSLPAAVDGDAAMRR